MTKDEELTNKEVEEIKDVLLDKITKTYPSSGQKRETYFLDEEGRFNGEYKKWYEDGQLETNCTYKHGKLNGKYRHFYPNGQLEEEVDYIMDRETGVRTLWNEDGSILDQKKF